MPDIINYKHILNSRKAATKKADKNAFLCFISYGKARYEEIT